MGDWFETEIQPAEGSCPILRLPNELLDYIFSFLSIKQRVKTFLVCKSWGQVPWSWPKSLCIHYSGICKGTRGEDVSLIQSDTLYNHVSSVLNHCGKSVKHLQLVIQCTIDCDPLTTLVAQYCPNLVDLRFSNVSLSDEHLKIVSAVCSKLKVLCLRHCHFSLNSFKAFLQQCENLECMDVDNPVTGCLDVISHKLRILRLICPNTDASIQSLLKRCDNLQELCLVNWDISPSPFQSNFLVQYKPVLQSLYLKDCSCIDWCYTLQVLHKLESLSLYHSPGIDDSLLEVIRNCCPKLKALRFCKLTNKVTDKGLGGLRDLPHLQVIDFSLITGISGSGLRVLGNAGILQQVYARNTAIDEDSFTSLARTCPNLHILDVGGNEQVTDKLVEEFETAIAIGFLKNDVIRLLVKFTSVSFHFTRREPGRLVVDFGGEIPESDVTIGFLPCMHLSPPVYYTEWDL